MKVHWAKCGGGAGNFGDSLTALILDYLNIPHEWAPPESAELFGIGSIVEAVPDGYTGVVWSSGQIRETTRKDLRRAQVLALRGPHTLERTQCADPHDVALGDGGLLCDLFHRSATRRYKLGIIPHYVHAGDPAVAAVAAGSSEITIVDICGEPLEVIQHVGQCQHILSSSLHGLVLADSLGIPSEWMELDNAAELLGRGFKFEDYLASFGLAEKRPTCLHATDDLDALLPRFAGYARPGIDDMKARLLDLLRDLPRGHGVVMWTRADLDMASRETRALSGLGNDFCAHMPAALPTPHAALPSARACTPLGEAHEILGADAPRLAQFFRACIALLRQLQNHGISHRAVCIDKLSVRDGNPVLSDFRWAVSDDHPLFRPHGVRLGEPLTRCNERDLQDLARVFKQINRHRHGALDAIIQLMTCSEHNLRVKDLGLLEALLDTVAQDRSSARNAPVDSAVPQVLLMHLAQRDRRVAAQEADLSMLHTELWSIKRLLASSELTKVLASDLRFILVDEDQLSMHELIPNCRAVPFPECDGFYAGPPADDDSAISELERLHAAGADFMVFAWPSFWWFDHYVRFTTHLRSTFTSILENERLVVFDLRSSGKWRSTDGAEIA